MDIHFNDTQPANASAETLFDVLTDYPDYPTFNSAIGCPEYSATPCSCSR